MKVLICGGGIGGLVTALCLHDARIDCAVFEQSDTMGELGVGINVLPHAIKTLAGLGLRDRLERVAIKTSELIYTNRFGQEIWREPRGREAGYDVPQLSIHRGRLQGVLYEAVRERLGAAALRHGHRLVGFHQDVDGVTARFVNRAGDALGSACGDLLVGADGIHSTVRARLFPDEGPPRWNGVMAWRGATDWPQFLTGRSMIIAGGMCAKLVLYPIAEGDTAGAKLTNWAVGVKIGDGSTPPPRRQDWARPGRVEDLLPHVELFSLPHVDVKGLVGATPEFYELPMCDRDPLPFWSHERVTLLGDAAHPMYPVGSNGAGQAVLDAAALGSHLSQHSDPITALRAYQDERLPATAEIVRMNRAGGPERVIDEVERRAPNGFDRIEDVVAIDELEAIVKGYAKASRFALEQVNR
ncbi:MAG: flavin-dependent oxidoreductase [Vicinamibacteraceae bacterium]